VAPKSFSKSIEACFTTRVAGRQLSLPSEKSELLINVAPSKASIQKCDSERRPRKRHRLCMSRLAGRRHGTLNPDRHSQDHKAPHRHRRPRKTAPRRNQPRLLTLHPSLEPAAIRKAALKSARQRRPPPSAEGGTARPRHRLTPGATPESLEPTPRGRPSRKSQKVAIRRARRKPSGGSNGRRRARFGRERSNDGSPS
jgi:hypothetical protein